MVTLGLKGSTSLSQIVDRLKYIPNTYEFHLVWEDLSGLDSLIEKIQLVYDTGVEHIVLHHPMRDENKQPIESYVSKEREPERYHNWKSSTLILNDIVNEFKNKEYSIKALVHISYGGTNPTYEDYGYSQEEAFHSLTTNLLAMYEQTGDNIIYENGAYRLNTFSFHNLKLQQFFIDNNIPICMDISHLYISTKGSNKILKESLIRLKHVIKHYHIVDSLGQVHDSLVLGQGTINWKIVKPLLNPYATSIFEINLQDQNNCQEMLDSYNFLKEI